MAYSPPKYPLRFLHWFCKADLVEEIEGDLNEEFEERIERLGIKRAQWLYTWQVITFFRPYAIKSLNSPIFNPIPMYLHYLKVAYRNLRKQKVPGFIKTAGLAIGLSTCLLILMYVNYELDFDRFHDRPEDVFRLTFSTIREDGVETGNSKIPMGMLPDIVEQVPEIEFATGFSDPSINVMVGEKIFRGISSLSVDTNFFNVFQFPLVNEQIPDYSQTPNGIYITEGLEAQLFGNEKGLNKLLKIWSWKDTLTYEVVGILADVPSQSHVQFELLYPKRKREWTYSWKSYSMRDMSYVRKYKNASSDHLQSSINAFIEATGGTELGKRMPLQPMLDIHLTSNFNDELQPNGDIRDVYLFSGIAILILCIALINYILTVSADFSRRLREIGIRKATGALRKNIIGQFFTETFLFVVLAVPLVVIIVYTSLPAFSELVGRPLYFGLLFNQWSLWILLGGMLLVIFVAGTYPAWVLGRMNTVDSIKGKLINLSTTQWVRKSLLFTQFAITVALIASMGVIYRQIGFINEMDLGFERDNKLIFYVGYQNSNSSVLKQKILQHTDVKAASITSWIPAKSISGSGSFTIDDTNEVIEFWFLSGDEDLLKTYGIAITAGQGYTPGIIQAEKEIQRSMDEVGLGDEEFMKLDRQKHLIVNESLMKTLNIKEEPGHLLDYPSFRGKLLGVIKDFNVRDIYEPIKPITYEYTDKANYMVVAYEEGTEKEVLSYVQESWHEFEPSTPLNYFFLEEYLNKVYDKENRLLTMIGVFSFLAIALACLGVFGLATISAEQRTKEIGIRKVLGANLSHILVLLNKDFVRLILVAIIIAIPVSMYFMNDWLSQFAYKIQLQPWEFMIATLVVLAIVVLTVSIRSLAVALANPVSALRQE